MENNDNEKLENEQQTPVIEKVSLKNIEAERAELEMDEDNPFDRFIETSLKLNDEDLDKAIAFLKKKLEILKNKK